MQSTELIGIALCCVLPLIWTVAMFMAGAYVSRNGWPLSVRWRMPGKDEEDLL